MENIDKENKEMAAWTIQALSATPIKGGDAQNLLAVQAMLAKIANGDVVLRDPLADAPVKE